MFVCLSRADRSWYWQHTSGPQAVGVSRRELSNAVRLYPWRVHPDNRVSLSGGDADRDTEEVCQSPRLHLLLPEPLHRQPLGGHCAGLQRHRALHRYPGPLVESGGGRFQKSTDSQSGKDKGRMISLVTVIVTCTLYI